MTDAHINEDEIDLRELFLSLWAYKLFIALVTMLSIFGAGYYALTADKIYSARSTFVLPQSGGSNMLSNITSQLGGLASLAGLPSGGGDSSAMLIERITSREFVLETAGELELQNDKFFNNYDPNAKDPAWKAIIKNAIGYESGKRDPQKMVDWNLLSSFSEHVTIEATQAGAMSVSVKHKNPERAAEIANYLAQKIIALTNRENLEEIDAKLSYLSQTLANATEDFEAAQSALKDYGLNNSAQAVEAFAAGSVMLDDLRSQRQSSEEQLETLRAIISAYEDGAPKTQADYLALRARHPLVDQPNFRRILGLSEVASAWKWPPVASLSRVESSIKDRLAVLDAEILKLEADATKYAENAEELSRLTRDAKIAEAAYKVLIEQVKGQSLIAGFTPDNSKIIEVADVPLSPVEPKRSLILALGMVLGLFLGSAIALILSMRRGVYYSRSSLTAGAAAKFAHPVRGIKKFQGKSIADVAAALSKTSPAWARQSILELESNTGSNVILVCDTTKSCLAGSIGRVLGATGGSLGRSVAFIDLAAKSQQASTGAPALSPAAANIRGVSEHNFNSGAQNIDMLFAKNIRPEIDRLSSAHDLVIITADYDAIDAALSSPALQDPKLALYAQTGKTKSETITRIISRGKIEVLLHD